MRTPETRFSPIVATVSRRFASQPSRIAWPMSPGNCRAIEPKPVSASRLSWACQYDAASSAVSSSASDSGSARTV